MKNNYVQLFKQQSVNNLLQLFVCSVVLDFSVSWYISILVAVRKELYFTWKWVVVIEKRKWAGIAWEIKVAQWHRLQLCGYVLRKN